MPVDHSAKIGLPPRPFLYTLDQIGVIVHLTTQQIRTQHVYFEGRTIGLRARDSMLARNIAAMDQPPDWRVAEKEFVRWMRAKGFKYYDRGVVTM